MAGSVDSSASAQAECNHIATAQQPGGVTVASLTIKNIPVELYDMLKRSAMANHRSINSELIHCLEKTLKPSALTAAQLADAAQALRTRFGLRPCSGEVNSATF
jgi:plasmid stability protein